MAITESKIQITKADGTYLYARTRIDDIVSETINGDTRTFTNVFVNGAYTGTVTLGSDAVVASNISNSAVTTDKIASAAVTGAKIAGAAVTSAKLSSNSVTEAKISAGAVTTSKIANSAVTSDKIANSAITVSKIAPGAVDAGCVSQANVSNLVNAYHEGPGTAYGQIDHCVIDAVTLINFLRTIGIGGSGSGT